MEAVTIHDRRPFNGGSILAVNLIDILRLCEPDALRSSWRVCNVECCGELAAEFMELSDAAATIRGEAMLRFASGVSQIAWGDFEASRNGEEQFWLAIRAIDSSLYVVITEDHSLIQGVRTAFLDVRDSLEDSEYT